MGRYTMMFLDILGLVIIGAGAPLLIWFLATQDLDPVVKFLDEWLAP